MFRKAYAVQLTYDISDPEKAEADKALLAFNEAIKLLNMALTHLNIMHTPFKNHPDIDTKQLIQFRAALRRYRDKFVDNFNNFKNIAFKCISLLSPFSNDTQTIKLIKSFISAIEDLEKNVNIFSELFNNLQAKDFVTQIVKALDDIEQEVDKLKEMINDRIKSHIQSDILGKSWVNDVSEAIEMKMEEKTPLLIDLNRERQEQLSGLNNLKKNEVQEYLAISLGKPMFIKKSTGTISSIIVEESDINVLLQKQKEIEEKSNETLEVKSQVEQSKETN